MPNYNDDHRPNAIERDRMERRRQLKRKSMITNIAVIAVIAVVVIGIIIAIVALTGKNKKDDQNTEPTTVTATIASETQKPKATTAQQPTIARADGQNDAVTSQDDDIYGATEPDYNNTSSSQASSSASSAESGSSSAMSTGNSIHYTASGSTSYGYDWTYSGGSGIVSVECNYDFDSHQYDFVITGLSEGTTNLTLYYNTADGEQQPVNMTVSVDSNLNVSQIG